MRGKARCGSVYPWQVRITPAYAGKSASVELSDSSYDGSPPRMRGKELPLLNSDSPAGITPAYAGKRPRGSGARLTKKDHPRVCGEKSPAA